MVERSAVAFVAACLICGALSVPWHPVNTSIAAFVGGALGSAGVWLRRWAGLAGAAPPHGPSRTLVVCRSAVVWFIAGLTVGLVILATIRLIIEPGLPDAGARIAAAGGLPVWRRLVIIYVAAVGEELLFRVILVSLVAGALARVLRTERSAPTRGALFAAIMAGTLLFAGVHLPAWSSVAALTPGIVAMVMTLNAIGGVVFGYAFVTRGVLAAVCAHAGADCAIQLIGPLTR